jgi:NAD-dependent deacetylase
VSDAHADGLGRAADMLAHALQRGGSIAVLTGAGVSAESGIPTFRGGAAPGTEPAEALWSRFDPMDLASPEGFRRHPEAVTRWYAWRRRLVLETRPNPGHAALAELEAVVSSAGGVFTLLTQNVDRLHQRAGSGERGGRVVELHGDLLTWRCVRSGERFEGSELDALLADDANFPPVSPRDGSPIRPNVVWFGEALPADAIEGAAEAVASCDVFVAIGTSAVVYPAAGFISAAAQCSAQTIELNAEATPASGSTDVSVRGASGRLLPELVQLLADRSA